MNYKEYVLSKSIDILPFEESFFFKAIFEKKVNLTDTLIRLNYKKYSPYKSSFFTKLMENQNLYIWFYEKEISSKIILPESYLLFNFFKEEHPNTFLLIEGHDIYNVIIIQNNILVNTYTLVDKDENLISMEINKYGLDSYKEISKKEYFRSKQKALQSIGLQELYKWSSIEVDKEKIFSNLINSIAYPLSFLLFFIMAIEVHHIYKIEKELTIVKEKYLEVKVKNDDIREKINNENSRVEKWITFVHQELPYSNSFNIFLKISKVFSKKNFIFTNFSIVGSKVKITMESKEDFVKGLNLLSKVDDLKNIIIKHNNRKRNQVTYEATILSKGLNL